MISWKERNGLTWEAVAEELAVSVDTVKAIVNPNKTNRITLVQVTRLLKNSHKFPYPFSPPYIGEDTEKIIRGMQVIIQDKEIEIQKLRKELSELKKV